MVDGGQGRVESLKPLWPPPTPLAVPQPARWPWLDVGSGIPHPSVERVWVCCGAAHDRLGRSSGVQRPDRSHQLGAVLLCDFLQGCGRAAHPAGEPALARRSHDRQESRRRA
eukprot:4157063-Prymnesium_polylepis.1